MSENATTRRGLLKAGGALGSFAALAAPAAFLTKVQAGESDPAFLAIAAHAAARERTNTMHSSDPGWDTALDEEGELWDAFCICRPTTVDGLRAYAAHAAAYPDLWVLSGSDGPAQIIATMAEALQLIVDGSAA